MDLKKQVTISTLCKKTGVKMPTALTLDCTGLTQDDINEYAFDSMIIRWQSPTRKLDTVPAECVYTVPKPGTRQAGVGTLAQFEAKVTIEQLEAMIAKKKTILRKAVA
jgi:hypothetical protein